MWLQTIWIGKSIGEYYSTTLASVYSSRSFNLKKGISRVVAWCWVAVVITGKRSNWIGSKRQEATAGECGLMSLLTRCTQLYSHHSFWHNHIKQEVEFPTSGLESVPGSFHHPIFPVFLFFFPPLYSYKTACFSDSYYICIRWWWGRYWNDRKHAADQRFLWSLDSSRESYTDKSCKFSHFFLNISYFWCSLPFISFHLCQNWEHFLCKMYEPCSFLMLQLVKRWNPVVYMLICFLLVLDVHNRIQYIYSDFNWLCLITDI